MCISIFNAEWRLKEHQACEVFCDNGFSGGSLDLERHSQLLNDYWLGWTDKWSEPDLFG